MSRPTKSLNAESLAQLFLQLAQLESAGLPPVQALDVLSKNDKKFQKPLLIMRRQLQQGRGIAESGFKAGIFDDTLKTLIHAAESGGKLASVYRQLAQHYDSLNKRLKKIRSRLYLPILTLIIALFVQPLPALASGDISDGQYVRMTVGTLALIALSVAGALRLPALFTALGLKTAWEEGLLQLPAIGHWLITRQLNEFFFLFALLLDAGLPFAAALPRAVATIKNSLLRAQFLPAIAYSNTGASVGTALALVPTLKNSTLQIIETGERSGKLAETLLHFTEIDAQTIALQDDALAEWLPRIVYSVIAVWMGYSIIGSGAFLPH